MGIEIDQIKTFYYKIMSFVKSHFYLLLLIPIIDYAYSLYDRHTHMDDEDLLWMNVYSEEDIRLFTSLDGSSIDTMFIYKKDIWNSTSLFWNGPIGGLYLAGGQFKYILIHDKDSITGTMSISKKEKENPVWLDFRLGGRFGFDIKQEMKTTIIHGIKYNDCIYVDDTNSSISEYFQDSLRISSFIWSKSYGLLEYTFVNSDKYQINEIHTK